MPIYTCALSSWQIEISSSNAGLSGLLVERSLGTLTVAQEQRHTLCHAASHWVNYSCSAICHCRYPSLANAGGRSLTRHASRLLTATSPVPKKRAMEGVGNGAFRLRYGVDTRCTGRNFSATPKPVAAFKSRSPSGLSEAQVRFSRKR